MYNELQHTILKFMFLQFQQCCWLFHKATSIVESM